MKATTSKSKEKPKHKPAAHKAAHAAPAHKAEPKVKAAPRQKHAGAHTLGPPDFVVTRKHSKPVESHVGAHLRVELPENDRQGLNWQLQKLPHGVALAEQAREPHAGASGHELVTHNRVFHFEVEEAGSYELQFHLNRPFSASALADTFRVKVRAN
jgi:hypothetical protein